MSHVSRSARSPRGFAALRALALLGASAPAILALAAPAAAQDYTNITASGRVLASDGQPIAGAVVEVTSLDQGFTRTVTTNESGAYTIPQLNPGEYRFSVSAPGYDNYAEDDVRLSRRTGSANTFTLNTEGMDTIVITAQRVQTADFENTTTGAVIDLAELDQTIPVARSLRDVALLAPGVVEGNSTNAGFRDQITISGATFTENAYYVNGLNTTDFRMGLLPVEVPYDFYETVEVKTGGLSAEFGRITGGFVNATTKAGSNEFHASILGTWEPQDLRGYSPDTEESRNTASDATRQEITLQASGPIIRDHLFVYGLYTLRDYETFTPDADQDNATRVTNDSPFTGLKLDGYLTDTQHFELTYFDTSNEQQTRSLDYDRQTGTLGEVTGGTNSRNGGENWTARYTGTFTDWFTFSAAYGINKHRGGTLPLDITNERVIDYRNSDSGIDIGLNKVTDAYSFNDDEREFYRADADFNFDFFGSHHVRVGYDYENNQAEQVHETMGDGFYYIFAANQEAADRYGINVGQDYYRLRVYRNSGSFTTENSAYYIQDNWSLLNDRLTLQLGVRNDHFSNQGIGGVDFWESDDLWSPRLGFSADVFGDARTKVYGSYSQYYLPMPGDLNLKFRGGTVTYHSWGLVEGIDPADGTPILGDPILGAPGFSACPDTGIANCEVFNDGTPSSTEQSVAANLEAQSSHEFLIGAEHRLNDDITLGVYYLNRELDTVIEDISIDAGAIAYCVAQGFSQGDCEALYPGGSQFVLANPGEDVEVELRALPDGTSPFVTLRAEDLLYDEPERSYHAVTFTFDRAFDGVWSLAGSYTWSSDKGNYEGGVRSENGQMAINTTSDFDSPGFQNGAYGYLPNHREHTLKVLGTYRFNEYLDLGANLIIQSPRKYSCIGAVPEDVDPYAHSYHGYSYYCQGEVIERGSAFDGDWLQQVDVSAVYHIPMPGDRFDASLRLDVFNVFNFQSVTSFNEFGELRDGSRNSLFGTPAGYQTPRYARLQFRVGF